MNAARLIGIYRAYLAIVIAIQVQYRAMLVIWLTGLILQPLMYLVVWTTVAESRGEAVGGYTAQDFAAYFLISMVVTHLTFTWLIEQAEFRVRQGEYSPLLLKPFDPIHLDLAWNATFKLLTLVVMIPAALMLGVVFDARFSPPWWAVLAMIPALVMAYFTRYFLEYGISALAFWLTRMSAINRAYSVLALFLTGQLAPLSLFPEPVRLLATVLPFRWFSYFPVELLMGRLSAGETLAGLLMQLFWLVATYLGMKTLWRQAIKRYSAVGA